MKEFTTQEVSKETGIPKTTLNDWVRRGLIRPSIEVGGKQGKKNLWSEDDVEMLKRYAAAKQALRDMADNLSPLPPTGKNEVVVIGEKVRIVRGEDTVAEVMRRAKGKLIVIVKEV